MSDRLQRGAAGGCLHVHGKVERGGEIGLVFVGGAPTVLPPGRGRTGFGWRAAPQKDLGRCLALVPLLALKPPVPLLMSASAGVAAGQKAIRPYWRNYFENTDALVTPAACLRQLPVH